MVHWAGNINGSSVMLIKPMRQQVEILRKYLERDQRGSVPLVLESRNTSRFGKETRRCFLALVRCLALSKRKKQQVGKVTIGVSAPTAGLHIGGLHPVPSSSTLSCWTLGKFLHLLMPAFSSAKWGFSMPCLLSSLTILNINRHFSAENRDLNPLRV